MKQSTEKPRIEIILPRLIDSGHKLRCDIRVHWPSVCAKEERLNILGQVQWHMLKYGFYYNYGRRYHVDGLSTGIYFWAGRHAADPFNLDKRIL